MKILKIIAIIFIVSFLLYALAAFIFAYIMSTSGKEKDEEKILAKIPEKQDDYERSLYGYWEGIHPRLKRNKNFLKKLIEKNPHMAPYALYRYNEDIMLNEVLLSNYYHRAHDFMGIDFINNKENFERIYSRDKSIVTNENLDESYKSNREIFEDLYKERSIYILGMADIYSEDDNIVSEILTENPNGFNESYLSDKYKNNIELALKLLEIDAQIIEGISLGIKSQDEFIKGAEKLGIIID